MIPQNQLQDQVFYRNVLLVGGTDTDNTWIRTSLAKKLHRVGLIVKWIWSGDISTGEARARAIPEGCDLIILLGDWMGHSMAEVVVNAARKQNVRFVRGVRKWSKLQDILLEKKIINQADIDTAAISALADKEELPDEPLTPTGLPMPSPVSAGEVPPQLPASWTAAGQPLDELLKVFRNVVAELITGHDVENIKIDNSGHITMDVKRTVDLNEILK